jgi:hypothetical protein
MQFGLAIENTRDPDYITEKLFEVLESGAVPVYLGAPNWREFVPFSGMYDTDTDTDIHIHTRGSASIPRRPQLARVRAVQRYV